jgi:hypothetical protein
MTPQDESDFLAAVYALAPEVRVVQERAPKAEPVIVSELPAQGSREAREGVVLWNPAAGSVIMHDRGTHFLVDKVRSPVIELRQSEVAGEGIRRGRIWAEIHDGEQQKGEDFQRWFDQVARWIRSHFSKDQNGHFVGPHAASSGYRLL